jgi:hypothetical protein
MSVRDFFFRGVLYENRGPTAPVFSLGGDWASSLIDSWTVFAVDFCVLGSTVHAMIVLTALEIFRANLYMNLCNSATVEYSYRDTVYITFTFQTPQHVVRR